MSKEAIVRLTNAIVEGVKLTSNQEDAIVEISRRELERLHNEATQTFEIRLVQPCPHEHPEYPAFAWAGGARLCWCCHTQYPTNCFDGPSFCGDCSE